MLRSDLTVPSLQVELDKTPQHPTKDMITIASPPNIMIHPTFMKLSVSMYRVGSYILGSILNHKPIPINVIPVH